jgi:hypothetical protein
VLDLKKLVKILAERAHPGAGVERLRIEVLDNDGGDADVIMSSWKKVMPGVFVQPSIVSDYENNSFGDE